MAEHSIFYYPYGSFTDAQAPLLKAAALYFDKLYILDPVRASWASIGPGEVADDVGLLEEAGILERIAPAEVLHEYEDAITASIQADMADPEFNALCQARGGAGRWTLALAKVPKSIRDSVASKPLEDSMRKLMSDTPRTVWEEGVKYDETYYEYAETASLYDELRETHGEVVEYRYADYPLALGEAIMVNHALFGGMAHLGAVPLTDEPFHHDVLGLKMKRAAHMPEGRRVVEDQAAKRKLKADQLAAKALTDVQLSIISPKAPLSEILAYRNKHGDALVRARKELAWLAREISDNPWSKEFAEEVDSKSIPAIRRTLQDARKARDSWLRAGGERALEAVGVAAGTAAVAVPLVFATAPLLPVVVATGLLGLVTAGIVPGGKLIQKWREGREEAMGSGFSYLLNLPEMKGQATD